eukprot:9547460-Prorocentrum_lima.AAC.1
MESTLHLGFEVGESAGQRTNTGKSTPEASAGAEAVCFACFALQLVRALSRPRNVLLSSASYHSTHAIM